MSIRSFVALCSCFLMAWLSWAFVHTPVVRSGVDPVSAEVQPAPIESEPQPEDLTVSVSQ